MVVQGYSARIKRGDLQVAGEHLFQSTSEVIGNLDPGDRVIMDPVARLMPGLGEQFPQAAFVDNTALPQAVEQNQVRLLQRDQAIVYVTSLPCPIQSTPVPAAPEPARQVAATHLLMGASAAPLVAGGTPVGAGWELHYRAGAWRLRGDSSAAAQVNGADYHSGQPLHCGDTICIDAGADAATSAMLIEVKA
jgi:hypothetical protein